MEQLSSVENGLQGPSGGLPFCPGGVSFSYFLSQSGKSYHSADLPHYCVGQMPHAGALV